MGTYQGARTIDGVKVLADGQSLDHRTDLNRFTDRGFEWTYEGVEPAQLALAWLLAVDDLVIPIPGTTKSKHLAENFAAGGITVDDHTLAMADRIVNRPTVLGDRYNATTQAQLDTPQI